MLAKLDCVSDFSRKLIPIFLASILGLVLVDVVGFKLYDWDLIPDYDGFTPIFMVVTGSHDVSGSLDISGHLSVSE